MASIHEHDFWLETYFSSQIGSEKFQIFSSLPINQSNEAKKNAAITGLMATTDSDTNTNNIFNANYSESKFSSNNSNYNGQLKRMELSINELIELSSLAASRNKPDVALTKACESVEQLNSLKTQLMVYLDQQQLDYNANSNSNTSISNVSIDSGRRSSSISSNSTSGQRPMQTPMTTEVNLSELEIMVTANLAERYRDSNRLQESLDLYTRLCKLASSQASGRGYTHPAGSSTSQDSKVFVLYRFGLNLANIYNQMGEYQRALKYYRLTMDRLASTGAHKQLSIKLNYNIALTLWRMNQKREASVVLNRLLASNIPIGTDATIRPYNANHHTKFSLSLMVLLYELSDLTGMLSTLKQLLRVDTNEEYERVQHRTNDGDLITRGQSMYSTYSMAIDLFGASSKREHNNLNENDPRKQPEFESQKSSKTSIDASHLNVDNANHSTTSIGSHESRDPNYANQSRSFKSMALDAGARFRLVMKCIQQDQLERIIVEKHEQICSSLIKSFNLLLQLSSVANKSRTSVLELCLKLLQTGDSLYKNLACDFKLEQVFESLLKGPNRINQTIGVLRDIDSGWAKYGDTFGPVEPTNKQPANKTTQMPITARPISCMVNNNLSVLKMLEGNLKQAISLTEQAIHFDAKSNGCLWINLANCHSKLNNIQLAERAYSRAQETEPNNWLLNYDLAQFQSQKLGRHFDDLNSQTRASLSRDKQQIGALVANGLVLSLFQLVNIYQNSPREDDKQAALSILFDDYFAGSSSKVVGSKLVVKSAKTLTNSNTYLRVPPEALLKASELIDPGQAQDAASKSKALGLLTRAYVENPYHLRVKERLIAVNIRDFQYESAKSILDDCIVCRPDQVKWYLILAECHRRAAEYDKAIATYKQAIELFPRNVKPLRALVKLTDELGLADELARYQSKLNKALSFQNINGDN